MGIGPRQRLGLSVARTNTSPPEAGAQVRILPGAPHIGAGGGPDGPHQPLPSFTRRPRQATFSVSFHICSALL